MQAAHSRQQTLAGPRVRRRDQARAFLGGIGDALRWLYEALIRTVGFFWKELVTVLRQPRLMVGLVLGPFTILLLFGLGYRGPHPEFRTILVLPDDPAIASQVDVFQEGFSGVFKLLRITRDREGALAALKENQADVVAIVPDNVFSQVAGGRQAVLQVVYTETDPTSNGWVKYFAYTQTGELNRRILEEVLLRSKGPAVQALEYIGYVRQEIERVRAAVRAGDEASALARVDELLWSTQAIQYNLAQALDTLSGASEQPAVVSATELLSSIEADLQGLRGDLLQGGIAGRESALRRLRALEAHVDQFEALARRVDQVPVHVLVSPLRAESKNVAPVEPSPVAFYMPAVVALLLQHIAVTLSSLSAVRDRLLGTMELFRVSPTGAGQILLGKSLGFGVLLGGVGVALTLASTRLLGVPMLGSPLMYWLVVGLVVFASLGLGFAIAVIAHTESQAVQFSMIVLLTSVFFGGFFLPLNLLFPWITTVSYTLPVTYGAIDLRDIMLRGATPEWPYLAGPLALGLLFYWLALVGTRRQMRRA